MSNRMQRLEVLRVILGSSNTLCSHEEILRDYHIIVYPRKDCTIDTTSLRHSVSIVRMPEMDISSTMIRQLLRNGKDISPYVCPKVAQYLRNNAKNR